MRQTAERLGYIVTAAAATLASGRAQNVGVVVPLLDRWFFASVLDGIAPGSPRAGTTSRCTR